MKNILLFSVFAKKFFQNKFTLESKIPYFGTHFVVNNFGEKIKKIKKRKLNECCKKRELYSSTETEIQK
jgi:hypothetical protein